MVAFINDYLVSGKHKFTFFVDGENEVEVSGDYAICIKPFGAEHTHTVAWNDQGGGEVNVKDSDGVAYTPHGAPGGQIRVYSGDC